MKLRGYQKNMIDKTHTYLSKGIKKIVLVAPTGAGKSFVAANLMKDFVNKGLKVMFLVHRDVLVEQTQQELKGLDLDCGFIKAGYPEDRTKDIQIASIQTVGRRNWWKEDHLKPDVVIGDEIHLVGWTKTFKDIIEEHCPNAIVLGLTGSPMRLSKKEKFGDIFEKMISSPVPKELMEQGYLVFPSYYSLGKPNLKNVRVHAGDYAEESLRVEIDKPEVLGKIVDEWINKAYGKRTICFSVNVKHAESITEAFRSKGIPTACVTGKTPIHDRKVYYKALAEGKLLVLVSCNALSEGFNVKAVECAILARPTMSKALYIQQIGRALRTSPETGKTGAIILDYGNVPKHGFIEDIKSFRLERTGEDDGEENPVPLKECPQCHKFLYGFQMKCECGYEFTAAEKPVVEDVKLVRIFASKQQENQFNKFQQFLREAFKENKNPKVAQDRYRRLYDGYYPRFEWARGAIFGEEPLEENYREYCEYLLRCDKEDKNKAWIKKYLSMEFGDRYEEVLSNTAYWDSVERRLKNPVPTKLKIEVKTGSKSPKIQWKKILSSIEKNSVRELFKQQSEPLRVEGDNLLVSCLSKNLSKVMQMKIADLEKAVKEVMGLGVKLIV